ncbi:MAG TPA: FAD-dependent oxidoreductase [Phycisphaerae bacterium]|nr:FAD-dependent oxidoreductase [Phycisphaerae bacterium]
MSDKPDVVVVGGGVIGLSCAWSLRRRGLAVTLLEWRTCGSGASGASLGVLMPAPATRRGAFQTLQRQSLQEFPDWAQALRDRTGIDPRYRRSGLLEVIPGEGRRQQAVGESRIACSTWPAVDDAPVMAVLDAAGATALEPQIAFQEYGGRLCRTTANVDVARLIDALRAVCVADGVEVQENCAVHDLEVRDGRVRGVVLADRRLAAGTVLVTAGAWTAQVSPLLAAHAPMRPVRGQALRLRAPGAAFTRIIKQRGIYLIPDVDGTVIVGATTEAESGFNARPTAHGIAEVTAAALALAPVLADAEVIQTWAGLRPESATGHLVLGPVADVNGLYIAAGHYKTGIGLAPLTGRVMAAWIAEGEPGIEVAAFAPGPAAG